MLFTMLKYKLIYFIDMNIFSKSINVPGFTAEAVLYKQNRYYIGKIQSDYNATVGMIVPQEDLCHCAGCTKTKRGHACEACHC